MAGGGEGPGWGLLWRGLLAGVAVVGSGWLDGAATGMDQSDTLRIVSDILMIEPGDEQ